MKKWSRMSLVALLSTLLYGCGTTTASRIKEKQAVFDAHPPAIQERIQKGQVEPGDVEDMVYIALGAPDNKYERKTALGTSEIWAYSGYYTTPDRQRVKGEFRYRDSKGQWRTATDDVWVNVDVRHIYDKKRVEFQNNRVVAVEDAE
ncbi:MAG: hypothetical protein EOM20_05685 [Spartobacteria bacterium]|nr:hypothetical protein [Spartobacteria bacterium]